ncbi:protein tipD [Dorcoceras hygrometricum]|uniref:Protein tipD n=1 Tax=Dorcoceras hygrometricum TaxID=472368 RepID=A0A2Z7CBZ9_9LAMI|nr:protein tipD [Dorcoceras hygrometricum]
MDSRPPYSGIVRRRWAEVCVDIVQFYRFGHLQPVADDVPQTPPTDDITLDEATTADIPQIVLPSTDFTESFAQIQAIVDKIQFEQVQTRDNVADLKDALSSKITGLELGLQRLLIIKTWSIEDKKAVLAHDFLEFRVETQENFHTLSAQLSEIIAYINRGRDDKKGEDSSSRVPQPPEDRSRPGDGGRGRGRSSEPSKKRGGGLHRGGGTSSRGFSHWFG